MTTSHLPGAGTDLFERALNAPTIHPDTQGLLVSEARNMAMVVGGALNIMALRGTELKYMDMIVARVTGHMELIELLCPQAAHPGRPPLFPDKGDNGEPK